MRIKKEPYNLYSFNESATVLWNAVVGRDFTVNDMVAALISEYDVDENTARLHCEAQLRHWVDAGLIEAKDIITPPPTPSNELKSI